MVYCDQGLWVPANWSSNAVVSDHVHQVPDHVLVHCVAAGRSHYSSTVVMSGPSSSDAAEIWTSSSTTSANVALSARNLRLLSVLLGPFCVNDGVRVAANSMGLGA